MAVIDGTGMKYRGDVPARWLSDSGVTDTTRSVYEMWVGHRLVFLVSVVNDDPALGIQTGKPDADVTNQWYYSDGQAYKSLHELPATGEDDIPDGLVEHVDGVSLQQYVYTRLPLILVKMYDLGTVTD